ARRRKGSAEARRTHARARTPRRGSARAPRRPVLRAPRPHLLDRRPWSPRSTPPRGWRSLDDAAARYVRDGLRSIADPWFRASDPLSPVSCAARSPHPEHTSPERRPPCQLAPLVQSAPLAKMARAGTIAPGEHNFVADKLLHRRIAEDAAPGMQSRRVRGH